MSSKGRPRVLLADDHQIVAEGINRILSAEFDLVGVVEDGRALVEAAKRLQPDVIVADITMPLLNGIDALTQLLKWNRAIKVVILSMHADAHYARRALQEGAAGYVLKHSAPAELLAAIRAALNGQPFVSPALTGRVIQSLRQGANNAEEPAAMLTPRQREILQLLAEGKSAKEIAGSLGISPRTVEFHKYQMMDTLRLKTGADLVRFAVKHGIVPP
ncbi:MAG: response regulator [Limisphaerales bacterium]